MLMFTRRLGERIIIGGCIEVRITEIHRSTVRLAISAPMNQSVLRGEMYEAVAKANREAVNNVDLDESALIADGKRILP
jgi:carbon storage regulator